MQPHPLASLLPVLSDEALYELVADVREHGLRDPIMTLDGLVLDGRNRLRACELAGVAPRFVAFSGTDALAYVASMNLYRRHLNESQRAMVAAKIIEIYERAPIGAPAEQAAVAASVAPPIGGPGKTTARVAALVNVGSRSVERARQVVKGAAPEVVAAVERGTLAISAAAELSKKPHDQQRQELANPAPRRRPVVAPQPPAAIDDDAEVAARLEKRIEAFVGDVRQATPRARRYLRPALENALRSITRIVQESAA